MEDNLLLEHSCVFTLPSLSHVYGYISELASVQTERTELHKQSFLANIPIIRSGHHLPLRLPALVLGVLPTSSVSDFTRA